MKKECILLSLGMLLAVLAFAQAVVAQNSTQNAVPAATTNVLAEDEHLPFMQTEEMAAAPQEPSSGGLIVKSIGALLLVISLLFFGTWTLKKLGVGGKKVNGSGGELSLTVLSTLSMGNGRTISTIQFGERILLVGATPQNFTLLAEEAPSADGFAGNPRSVAEMLEDEGRSFDDEFEMAQTKLGMWQNQGGAA